MVDTDNMHDNTLDDQAIPNAYYIGVEDIKDAVEDPAQELRHRRAIARSIIAAFAASSAALTTVPLPFKDAVMLSPIELAQVNALARVYDIPQGESLRQILGAITELGMVSVAARGAIGVLDKAPKIVISSKLKSAVIAAVIVGGIGIGTTYVFEQVYIGKLSPKDIGLFNKLKQSKTLQSLLEPVNANLQKVMNEDTLTGLKVSVAEMAKAFIPVF